MQPDGILSRGFRIGALFILIGGLGAAPASAAVGDQVHTVLAPFFSGLCSVGLAADGTSLFYSRCTDRNVYRINPISGALLGTFDTGIPELPNALAFDSTRHGLWIGAQGGTGAFPFVCGVVGAPIYFWDFDDNSVTKAFTLPANLINPANGDAFFHRCFIDGLAFNANNLADPSDDELWISDDAYNSIMVFRPDGTFIRGYEASTVDASLAMNSGLAIGGPDLYMGNAGGGDVYRADIFSDPLAKVDQFTSGDTRQEDMECDPITFAPIEVMWVRTTTQAGQFPDAFTAYEIEPDTCGIGGQDPACGDGNLDAGEECDDGNDTAGDGCSPFCRLESCGNGFRDPSEQCDDGNTEPGDGCSARCLIEICGNEILDPGEACDDGNLTGGDGCSADCAIEACGNGVLDTSEQCDDGNLVDGDGCSAECHLERCGNGELDPGEECDDGNGDGGDGCSAECRLETCGNEIVDPGEECDDGNLVDGDGCSADCAAEPCGNGRLDDGEECDDGNFVPDDGCSAACTIERCGNGILDPREQCDDGNQTDGDGCSANCTFEEADCGCLDLDDDGWVTDYGPCHDDEEDGGAGDKHNRWLPDCRSFNDCNDDDPTIHPLAVEIPNDGIDQNCNGIMKCGAMDDEGSKPWTFAALAIATLAFAMRRRLGGMR